MNRNKVEQVEREAHRVLENCRIVRELAERESESIFFGCRETARLRRASHDLSEALVDLRKPS